MGILGRRVVVDYQFRLEKELKAKNVWVAAYTDDVFAYVASERMRSVGGYEVDFSCCITACQVAGNREPKT